VSAGGLGSGSAHGFRDRRATTAWAHSPGSVGPNMTPMVDVVMVILIFFMAGTALVGREFFLAPALPNIAGIGEEGDDPYALPPAEFTIDIHGGDQGVPRASGLGLANATIDEMLAALRRLALQAPTNEMTILVRAGGAVAYRDVVAVLDGCEAAGFQRVGLVALE
jgi:biopolymer transport protein ExbD